MGGRGAKQPGEITRQQNSRNGIPKTYKDAVKALDREAEQVDYDSWGNMLDRFENQIREKDTDGTETILGRVYDDYQYESEPDIRPITKKAILEDIDAWRNDDGTYGDSDTSIGIYYSDGKYVNTDDLDGKAYKKSGIIGVNISTGDYESVWGDYTDRNGQRHKMQTWSEDGESGVSNSYSGYRTARQRKVRTIEVDVPVYNSDGTVKKYERRRNWLRVSNWVKA